jgi:hypothetical protein
MPTLKLWSTRDVSECLKISKATLESWRSRGGGPAFVRVGKRAIRYTPESVRDFVESSNEPSK